MAELFVITHPTDPGTAAGFCFLLGSVIGSFCSVLGSRLPRGESIVTPRSHCPHCMHVLGPTELVPVLSYIWLRGRCRGCQAPISWHYPAREVVAGSIGAICALVAGLHAGLLALAAIVVGHASYGLLKCRSTKERQAGISLVEVLVSGMLLATVSAASFELVQSSMRAEKTARHRAVMVGLAQYGLARAWQEAEGANELLTFDIPTSEIPSPYSVKVYVEASLDNLTNPPNPPPPDDGTLPGTGSPPKPHKVWAVRAEVTCACMSNPVELKGVVTSGP